MHGSIEHLTNVTNSANIRYVSDNAGLDKYHGKNELQAKKTIASALTGIGNNTRIEIGYGNYAGGININNLYSVDLCGTGVLAKTQTVIGGLNTVTGTSSHVGFRNLNIGSNSADVLVSFSGSGGAHVFENVGSNLNLSPVLVQFGTASFSTTVPDLLTNFGKLVARFYQCDFSSAAGQIVLPDLPAGNYACIQVADCVIAGGISIGDGWNVLYNADSWIGPITYTGSATEAQYILTTRISASSITQDEIIVNGNTAVDTTGWKPETVKLVVCIADGRLDLSNTRIKNLRVDDGESSASGGPNGTIYQGNLRLVAGECFYILYRSPTESYYVKLRDPNLAEAALEYWAEYWVSNESGLSTNHGKSIEAPYQTVQNFLDGWIDFGSRVNLMSDYGHQGGWTLADQNYITFEGAGKTTMMYGSNEITGLCEHITFRNLTIANDITWGGQGAIKFTDIRGKHVIDNLWTELNTAAYYLEFGVNCYNGIADGITTFGALACTIKNSDLTGSTGIIKLPDLAASQYAYIKLENTQVSGIEIGSGWYVLYDGSSDLGTLTYTGSGSIFKVIPTSNSVPQKIGGLMTRDMNKLLIELQPTAENQVLKSVYMLGNFVGLQWATATDYPGLNQQVTNQSGSNMSAMLHQFKVSDGNYQSFDIVIDMWESGLGSGLFSRYVKLSGVFRMDLIQAAGTVDITNYIDKDQSNAPKGTLSLSYSAGGYGGPSVELNYQIFVPFTNLNINKRVLTHTFGN